MSPLTRRRLTAFRANRRGYYSLVLFALLFVVTLFADVLANDKPLAVRHNGTLYFPIVERLSEKTFGGDFETEADYKDPYFLELIGTEGWILWPPVPYHYRTISSGEGGAHPQPPSATHLLGTDDQGRDVMARVLYGLRISIVFGLTLALLSTAIGVIVGAMQGYYGGRIDLFGQRALEIWSGMPVLYLLIILASFTTPTFGWLLLIMLLFSWMHLVGIVRAEFLRGRQLDYVSAAVALGVSDTKIMWRHILPNAMVATLTFLPFAVNGAIITLTALDFLGFGLPPGSPSLGELVAQGKNNLQAPWLGITAFLVLSVLLSLLVFVGEALRDAFDPRLRVT